MLCEFSLISVFPNLMIPKESKEPLLTSLPTTIFAALLSEVTSIVALLLFLKWKSEFGFSVPTPMEFDISKVVIVVIPRFE